jgi:hypothetical protein
MKKFFKNIFMKKFSKKIVMKFLLLKTKMRHWKMKSSILAKKQSNPMIQVNSWSSLQIQLKILLMISCVWERGWNIISFGFDKYPIYDIEGSFQIKNADVFPLEDFSSYMDDPDTWKSNDDMII